MPASTPSPGDSPLLDPLVNQYINPANAITASRFLTVPVFIYCVDQGYDQWAAVALTVCAFFDVIDGKVAKLLGCTSAFGEVFDAVADAFCYGIFFLVLGIYGWAPAIPVIVVLLAGVVNTLMRGLYARRAGRATNYRSWAMERVVGYGGYAIGAGLVHYEVEYYYYAFAAVFVLVVVHDSKRMLIDPIDSPIDPPIDSMDPGDPSDPEAPDSSDQPGARHRSPTDP